MQQLRPALRLVLRQPLTSALAVVALALGIGLTTLMFSILNGAVLRGLPFERSDRLFHVAPFDTAINDDDEAAQWEFAAWRERQRSFEDLAGFYVNTANVVGPDGAPERYRGAWITPNTFGLLRVRPALGRDFAAADGVTGAAPAVIISDRLWRDRYGARPDVLGQPLRVNGLAATVIGVMPPRFAFPVTEDLWLALAVTPTRLDPDTAPRLEVIGRLRDGIAPAQAQAELATIQRALLADDPVRQAVITVEVKTYVEEFIGSATIQLLTTMLAAVVLVLVIACVNVTNLVLARAVDRTRDVAVRTALGASRRQVIGETLLEVGVLTLAGAVAGTALAWVGVAIFNRGIVDTNPPFWLDIRIDGTVLAFVAGITAFAAVVAGLAPAWRTSRQDVAPLLQDESRGSTGLRIGRVSRGLVAAEMALSFALLVVSGLMIQSLRNVTAFDPGFPTRDVLSARVSLPAEDYPDEASHARFAEGRCGGCRPCRASCGRRVDRRAAEPPRRPGGDRRTDLRQRARVSAGAGHDGVAGVLRRAAHRPAARGVRAGRHGRRPACGDRERGVRAPHYPAGAVGRRVRVVRAAARPGARSWASCRTCARWTSARPNRPASTCRWPRRPAGSWRCCCTCRAIRSP
ncbi:MAG: ABC transporter permease [Vicinamibacterales bacterium]